MLLSGMELRGIELSGMELKGMELRGMELSGLAMISRSGFEMIASTSSPRVLLLGSTPRFTHS